MRGIPSYPEKLHSDVEGVIENIDGVIYITKIRVKYHAKIPKGKAQEARRAMEVAIKKCPAAGSVQRGIAIEWDGEIVEET